MVTGYGVSRQDGIDAPAAMPKPVAPPGPRHWPDGAAEQAIALQRLLAIGDRDWHALKAQRSRRAVEQLTAALVQLLQADDPALRQAGPARQQAIALVEHALGWLRGEISDPGCPQHGGPPPG
jgi:hypothetical protein